MGLFSRNNTPSFFVNKIVDIEKHLCMRIDFLEGMDIDDAHDYIIANPKVKAEILELLEAYDNITATGRTIDASKPYDYEDEHGFRYNVSNEIVCYPKEFYKEKRDDFLNFLERISSLIDTD